MEEKLGDSEDISIIMKISSVTDDKRLVFGWAYVCEDKDGNHVLDHSNQYIEPLELEEAVYVFASYGGMASEMHTGMYAGTLVESVVFTKEKQEALGIPPGYLPVGWWVGIRVYDDAIFAKVKDGTYTMLSLGGKAVKEETDEY
jgi:hypothetical protein